MGDKLPLLLAWIAAHSRTMDRNRSQQGWRASAFAAALFAITLNFFQPLVHAALLRDGAPSALWGVLCSAAAADPDADNNSQPAAVDAHECCLGLAHAAAFTAPPTAFVVLEPMAFDVPVLSPDVEPTPVGIRDGPTRPRGPPSLA